MAGVNRFELLLTESKSVVLTITLYAIEIAAVLLQNNMTTYWLFILAVLSIRTPNRLSPTEVLQLTCVCKVVSPFGADSWSRTNNLLITNQLLCHWAISASQVWYEIFNAYLSLITVLQRSQQTWKTKTWWTFLDSNQGPFGYEPNALTNCAKGPYVFILVGVRRFELPTLWSQTTRATKLRHAPIKEG